MIRKRLAALSGSLLAGALLAGDAFARAGGGGHGGGGGGGGGGHSSGGGHYSFGSGGGGDLSLGGFITLLIIFLIFWTILRRIQRGRETLQANANMAPNVVSAVSAVLAGPQGLQRLAQQFQAYRAPLPPALETIRAQDPGFEIETFLQRAEMSLFLVKRGVQRNDPAAIRPYLTDPLFAELAQQVSHAKAQHRHWLLESLNVRAVHLVDARADEQGQALIMHFDLVYRSKTLDDANRVVADEGADHQHGEQWTFVRAAGARTSTVGDVTASRCPSCGAELKLSLDGICLHCKASVTNGSVDWSVAEIQPAAFMGLTSEQQFAVAAPSIEQGVAALKAQDAAFSIEAFQGRVATAFTALQDAWCKQNLDGARAFLSPGAYFAWRAQLETMAAEGRRNVMENLRVLAIQPMRIVHGRVFDDLTVRISAASADYEIDQSGRIVFGDRSVRPFTEEWTFQRSVGVATSNKPGTLENTCPSCGAPVALTQIGECRYCKAAVASGKFDWVVSRIEQED